MEQTEIIYHSMHGTKSGSNFNICIFEHDMVVLTVGPTKCQTMMHVSKEDLIKISEDIRAAILQMKTIADQKERDRVWIKESKKDDEVVQPPLPLYISME
jgi:hypothetical protein